MTLNIFDTKDAEYIRKETLKFLKEEAKDGAVEITLETENFVCAKIGSRKRLKFYLHYGAFRFTGKEFRLSIFNGNANIEIDGADVDLNGITLNGFLDNVSVSVDY